jgi:hypothetical protein
MSDKVMAPNYAATHTSPRRVHRRHAASSTSGQVHCFLRREHCAEKENVSEQSRADRGEFGMEWNGLTAGRKLLRFPVPVWHRV